MPLRVTLTQPLRTFKKEPDPSIRLYRNTALNLCPGKTISIGQPKQMTYDHRDQSAVPVLHADGKIQAYVLEDELNAASRAS